MTSLMAGAGVDGDVLVLRALGLGDALTAVPALRGIRRFWPRRRLVLAGPADVGTWLRERGIVDEVLATDQLGLGPGPIAPDAVLPWRRPGHVAVNLHGRGPASHRVLARTGPERLLAFRCPQAGHRDGPSWRDGEHEVDRWCRLLRSLAVPCDPQDLRVVAHARPERNGCPGGGVGTGPVTDVVLHPGASASARRWPHERWALLAARLAGTGLSVAVTGSPAEAVTCERVVAAAASPGVRPLVGLDLDALATAVAAARVLVCGDTGVAHLATALGTASVLLFGPSPPQRWGPRIDPERHRVLWHGSRHALGDPHGQTVDPALLAITVVEVAAAVAEQLVRPVGAAGS